LHQVLDGALWLSRKDLEEILKTGSIFALPQVLEEEFSLGRLG
jgi:hypothetical protein